MGGSFVFVFSRLCLALAWRRQKTAQVLAVIRGIALFAARCRKSFGYYGRARQTTSARHTLLRQGFRGRVPSNPGRSSGEGRRVLGGGWVRCWIVVLKCGVQPRAQSTRGQSVL